MRIFMAEKTRSLRVLHDLWKPGSPRVEEHIVIPVVADGRNFDTYRMSQTIDLHPSLAPKLMKGARRYTQAFADAKRHELASCDPFPKTIDLNVQRRTRIGSTVFRGLIEKNDHPTSAAIDDVFPL